MTVTEDVPQGAEFAVRIQGDSMSPYIRDGSVVYVNRDRWPLGMWAFSVWMEIFFASSITRTR